MSKKIPDYVNQHLAKHKARLLADKGWNDVVPQIVCADHTQLSVQASRAHYCRPRNDDGPWIQVEVWLVCSAKGRKIPVPSFGNNHIEPYAYVPVELVNKFIRRHGGLQED